MSALVMLTVTEARLFIRNPISVFMALLLPSLLLLLQGFVIPGAMEPIGGDNPAIASLRTIDFFVPISITVALVSVAVTNYPSAIGAYRENGVLRRLDVSETTLGNWVRAHREAHVGDEAELDLSERARLRELERRTRNLEMENAFLKKAAAYFAREQR